MQEKANQDAMKYLLKRMRSEYEVRTYLAKKGYDDDTVEMAITYLEQYGYLDDGKYCEAFINDRINFNPCGKHKLTYDLKQKGVNGAVIEEALMIFFPLETEMTLAVNLWQKKKQIKPQTDPLKMKRYLAGKGFNYDCIEHAAHVAEDNLEEFY